MDVVHCEPLGRVENGYRFRLQDLMLVHVLFLTSHAHPQNFCAAEMPETLNPEFCSKLLVPCIHALESSYSNNSITRLLKTIVHHNALNHREMTDTLTLNFAMGTAIHLQTLPPSNAHPKKRK